MVRPLLARSIGSDDKDSLHKCIRPLASKVRLHPGHDEIRAPRSYQVTPGCEPAFLLQAYGAPIDCSVIFPLDLANSGG